MLHDYITLPRGVHLLCLGSLINRAGTMIVPFLAIYLHDALHVGPAFAPAAMGVFGLGSIGASFLGGQLADQIGRRAVMLFAMFGGATMLLLLSMVQTPALFLVGLFVFALIGETYRPAASAMIADLTAPAQRSHAYALMYIAVNLGFAIGPLLGGYLAAYSFKWLFLGDAATSAAYGLIILFGIAETMGRAARDPEAAPAAVGDPATAANPAVVPAPQRVEMVRFSTAMRHIAADRTFLLLLAAAFSVALLYMQSMSSFPIYLERLGFSPEQYGRIIAVNGLLIFLLQLPMTSWLKNRPRTRMLVISSVLTAIGFGLKSVATTELAFIGTVVIWTFGEMMQVPLLPPLVAELAPEKMRARYMGVFGMCFSGANTIGAPLGGLVLAQLGPKALWLGGAGLALLSGCFYMLIGNAAPSVAPAAPRPAAASADVQ